MGAVIGLALALPLMSGCGADEEVQNAEKTVSAVAEKTAAVTTYNSAGEKETEIFEKVPGSVIAIWQGPIETILALGEGHRIAAAIGIPNESCLREEYREAYEKIPYRAFEMPDKETVIGFHADFIVTSWGSAFSDKNIGRTEYWQSRGVKTYSAEIPPGQPEKRTVEQEYKFIRDMGKIFGVSERAEEIIGRMQEKLRQTEALAVKDQVHPRVMIVQYMGKNLMNWGDEYLQGDIVKRLGGTLPVPEKGYISKELLLEQAPDVVFLMVNEWDYGNENAVRERFMTEPVLNSLDAVRRGRVYILPLYEGQYSGVRTEDGIRRIAEAMYPTGSGMI